jgi:uptake hydrogenase large subunit
MTENKTIRVNIPLNRAEGDLEVYVEIADGVVVEAWSSGTMFRGFENMMKGRGALDGLVITPRICGICSLTHLTAAAEALDAITGIRPPDNARRLRNLALMVETVQSDVRHAVLMFMVDFANRKAYAKHPLCDEAGKRYTPLAGSAIIEVIRETKRLLEIVAIIGGQWPHTSFMVPGGVTSMPGGADLLQSRLIFDHFLKWYERSMLGCSIERWQAVTSASALDDWLEESPDHRDSEIGFFLRFAREAGLDAIGRGHNRFLSFGSLGLPGQTSVTGKDGRLVPAGYAAGHGASAFDQGKIKEDISHSWYEPGGQPVHPFSGETKPYASGQGGGLYSWIKAPRYDGQAVETGPLAEMIVAGDPLFNDLIRRDGVSVLVRELARLTRPVHLLPAMAIWLDELVSHRAEDIYRKVDKIPDGEGAGLIQAARGALGHWLRVHDEKITHYQVITPTSWNGSPRDANGTRGAWEEALIGTPVRDEGNPVEAGHVVRSFDPCLVCAVHTVRKGKKRGRLSIGFRS